MTRSLALSIAAGLMLSCSLAGWANEIFPVTHNEPVTVQVLSGKDGRPVPYAHLLVVAGYDQRDMRLQMWREETLTDAEGKALLSKPFGNLPFVQVWVNKAPLCQGNPGKAAFSVEQVEGVGLSTPNRCGIAMVRDKAGVFTVFVKPSKALFSPTRKDVRTFLPPVATPAPAAMALAPIGLAGVSPNAVAANPTLTPTTKDAKAKEAQKPPEPAKRDPAKEAAAPSNPWSDAIPVQTTMPASAVIVPAKQEQAKPAASATVRKTALDSRHKPARKRKSHVSALPTRPGGKAAPPAAVADTKKAIPSTPAAAPTKAPEKGAKAPAPTPKPGETPQPKAKPATAATISPGLPPPTPKIAVNLEAAPPTAVLRPAAMETTLHTKPSAAGRDLEQTSAKPPVRRRIKNPKDAAAAAAAAAARAAALKPSPAPVAADLPSAKGTDQATAAPAKSEAKKE